MPSVFKAVIYKPPAQAGPRGDGTLDRPSVIMFGNMEKGALPPNWREKLTASLEDMPVCRLIWSVIVGNYDSFVLFDAFESIA